MIQVCIPCGHSCKEPAEACWVCQSVARFGPSCETRGGQGAGPSVGEVPGRPRSLCRAWLHRGASASPGRLRVLRVSLTPLLSSYRVHFLRLARPRGPHGVFLLLGLRRERDGQLQVHIDVDEGGERQEDHHQEVWAWRLFSGVGVGGVTSATPGKGMVSGTATQSPIRAFPLKCQLHVTHWTPSHVVCSDALGWKCIRCGTLTVWTAGASWFSVRVIYFKKCPCSGHWLQPQN